MKHTLAASTAIVGLVLGGFAAASPAVAAPPSAPTEKPGPPGHAGPPTHVGPGARDLERYAADTWTSLAAMAHDNTGLPDDNIGGALDESTASGYTSPTNIGGYLWSTVTARDLGIIDADEARERLTATVSTLEKMERNEGSGMYYNWYAPDTGAKLEIFPTSGEVIHPFLSTVDNGWLAAGLRIVREAEPTLADRADALYESMDFSAFFDAAGAAGLPAGTNRGGFWEAPPGDGCAVEAPMYNGGGETAFYTCHHYDTTVSESRIATYLGIAEGSIPASGLYGTHRTMPAGCDWAWQEQLPTGDTRTYDGVDVFEGVYSYDGMSFVPSWGGSMFEALMPDLLIPEAEWGPDSWGVNHPITVEIQKRHGLDEAGYGYWGFSPASNPFGGYSEYGVDIAGIRSDGYTSDAEKTDVDIDRPGCSEGTNPNPTFGDGVVTPHAAFLALPYDRQGVLKNLRGLEKKLGAYGPGGFYDAVAVKSGTVAERYLSLDQSMIMAAIGNALTDDSLKDYMVDDRMEQNLRPAIEQQVFGSSWGASRP
ncbi:glucoamylase family protein [Microbacterium sp. S1037]|uniref:glucoamylase family protein n=1 Tax=Microbacterium sp. S1037 TaxID=3398227 RepID=UPI003AB0DC9A